MSLRENYFVKLMKYIKKVCHIDKQVEYVTDDRKNPTYKTPQIISFVLVGFLLRMQSFNQLNCMIKSGEFDTMISCDDKVPKIDTIRSSLKTVSLNCMCSFVQQSEKY